ncbi:MAG: polysaccharide biosynthesis tyrosine autokinase [Mucilaginibacter polytrichastri]|nr:polysaccharide biosynthesis tyrosine autokinase [Mucilaginibacter polytrichastri]
MEEGKNFTAAKLPGQEIDYFKIGKILLSRWYWIAGTMAVAFAFTWLYLWYTPKTYATSSTMKFEEKRSEATDLILLTTSERYSASKVQTESYVFNSRALILDAIRMLDYRISFYIKGRVRTTELYPAKPLQITILRDDSLTLYHDIITFHTLSDKQYQLTYPLNGGVKKQTLNYGQPVKIGQTEFSISPEGISDQRNIEYQFRFNLPEDLLGRARSGLSIREPLKNSNIVSLEQHDSNPDFASDFLNALMTQYLAFDKERKTQSASQIIQFIDAQLDFLSTQVRSSETSLARFKKNARVMDVSISAENTLGQVKDLEAQKSLLNIQLIAIEQLQRQIEKDKADASLNFNLEGTVDPLLGSLIGNLNTLLSERSALLRTYNEQAQPVRDINEQILRIKNSALTNIRSSRERISKNVQYINRQLGQANQALSALPAAEKDMVSLRRDFEINEKVYSFLSEKKLEAQISRSSILPGAVIVESAQANYSPVSPNEHSMYRTALVGGLLAGIGIIILLRIINPYIYDKETVESLTTVPIIGVIRKFPHRIDADNRQILSLSRPKSVFAESVRSVRTNLSFLAADKSSKVICITSEVAGEGKSFVAVNLATTLALIDKKVIIIAADLRRSKLHHTFDVSNDSGLSNYLAGQIGKDDLILKTAHENLWFIPSGTVPPNPSELLHNERMRQLVDELKKEFDIIMIDTAPVGLVSDSIPLIRISDINIFVIRSGKSKFYAATIPQRIAREYQLNNTVIILNAFAEDLLHSRYYTTKYTGEYHGGGYYYSDYTGYSGSGYYTEDEKKKWWNPKRWFS